MKIEKGKYMPEKQMILFRSLLENKDMVIVAERSNSSVSTVTAIRDRHRRILDSNYLIVENLIKRCHEALERSNAFNKNAKKQLKNIELDVE